jgi:hypothetical protein
VQNPSYPFASFRSRPHLKVKYWPRKSLVHWENARLFVTVSNMIWQYIFILLPVQLVFFSPVCICICANQVIPLTTLYSPLLSRTFLGIWIAFSDCSSFFRYQLETSNICSLSSTTSYVTRFITLSVCRCVCPLVEHMVSADYLNNYLSQSLHISNSYWSWRVDDPYWFLGH